MYYHNNPCEQLHKENLVLLVTQQNVRLINFISNNNYNKNFS